MKTGFKNVIEGKEGKSMANPWSFDQPHYDQRSSCFVNAGTDQGLGKRQPIGTKTATSEGHVPMGRVKTLQTYNVPYERLDML
jgi:hypothetical protein